MKHAFALAILCLLATPHLAFSADRAQNYREIENQIQALKDQIAEMKSARAPAAASDATPTSMKSGLSYKGLNLQFGGFLASETAYRSNDTFSDIGTNYKAIPFANNIGYGNTEFRGSERQSRFSLLITGDVNETTHLGGYYEIDFLGTTPISNPNESNSYAPRTRNVYMTADWDNLGLHFLAGQNWSMATLNSKGISPRNELLPATIDSQYAVGFQWARQWQMRLVKDWQKTYWLGLSLENAQTVNVTGTNVNTSVGGSYQNPVAGQLLINNISINAYPDVILKFAYESNFGHYEIYGMARNFQSMYGTGGNFGPNQTSKQSTWVEDIGAGATIPFLQKFDVTLSALYGRGAGRYGTVQLADASYNTDGSLDPLKSAQYLARFTYHVNPTVDAYLTYGKESVSASTAAGEKFGYGDGSVTTNAGCSTAGGSCAPNIKDVSQVNLGAWWTFYKGDYGVAKLGGQYSHTQLDTFADATGLAPSTTEDQVYTSLRFYPF